MDKKGAEAGGACESAEIIQLERLLLDGKKLPPEELDRLPGHYVIASPLLSKAYGERKADSGELIAAKEAFERAVKGFARQTFQRELLASLAGLAFVYLRMGEMDPADTLLQFLRSEFERGEWTGGGYVPLMLARGARRMNDEQRQSVYFVAAFEAFEAAGDAENACRTLLEMVLAAGRPIGSDLEEKKAYLLQRRNRSSVYADYADAFLAVSQFYERKWDEVYESLGVLRTGTFPYHIALSLRLMGAAAGLRSSRPDAGSEAAAFASQYGEDAAIPFELACLRFEYMLARRNRAGLRAAWEEAKSRRPLCEPLTQPESLDRMERIVKGGELSSDDKGISRVSWSVSCFGGMMLSRGSEEVADIQWKRKKAKELFVYLLLQPGYSATRDQVVEHLFADGELDKQANRLYVSVHQLKQVLHHHLGTANAILLKDGRVKIADQLIDYVDAEKYRTLIRVADQLWSSDHALSVELYGQAVQMYGELVPDLPYIDWLDSIRSQYGELQAEALKRLSRHALEQSEYDSAENYCREWLRLAPMQEEAFQQMMRILMKQGKHAEALGWYRQLEMVCREELQTIPTPESRHIVKL